MPSASSGEEEQGRQRVSMWAERERRRLPTAFHTSAESPTRARVHVMRRRHPHSDHQGTHCPLDVVVVSLVVGGSIATADFSVRKNKCGKPPTC